MFAHPDDVLRAHREHLRRRTDAHLALATHRRARPPDARSVRSPRATLGRVLVSLGERLQGQVG